FPTDQRPPVAIPFFAFRIMVGCAGLMLGIVLVGGWLRWCGRLYSTSLFLRLVQLVSPVGFVAVVCGGGVTQGWRPTWGRSRRFGANGGPSTGCCARGNRCRRRSPASMLRSRLPATCSSIC